MGRKKTILNYPGAKQPFVPAWLHKYRPSKPEHILIAVAKKELEELKRKWHDSEPGASAYNAGSELRVVMHTIAGMRIMAESEGL